MPLNKSKGNMYDFVTHTWNTIKGECPHMCNYCYMDAIRKRFKKECKPPYLDEGELKTNLGKDNFIFVGSSNDLFAESIQEEWIIKTLDHCDKFDNSYLFQSKNPSRILKFITHPVFKKSVVCTTIESNIHYPEIMQHSPKPSFRNLAICELQRHVEIYITIEPIMDFDIKTMVIWMKMCKPKQINIGANSGHKKLPEPSKDKVLSLIAELETFTKVKQKKNLQRLLK